MMSRDFYGYTVYSNGDIKGRNGRMLKLRVRSGGRKETRLNVNGERKNIIVSRLIYCLFNNIDPFELDRDQCVVSIDGDKSNTNIENLKIVYRGDLIQGSKHKSIAKLTDEEVIEIKAKYETTKDNKPVNQYDKNKPYNSYRSLAKEYGVTYPLIKQIIEGKTRNEKEYILKE